MGNVCVPNAQEPVRVQRDLPTCSPAWGLPPSVLWLRNGVQGIPGLIGPKYSNTGKIGLRGPGGLCLLPAWVLFIFLFLHWLRRHQTLHSPQWAESRRACKAKGPACFCFCFFFQFGEYNSS